MTAAARSAAGATPASSTGLAARERDDAKVVAGDLGLSENERMLRDLYAAFPDGLLVASKEGRIRLANDEAHRMFGYPGGALIGLEVEALVPSALRAAHKGHRDGYLEAPRRRRMGEGGDLVGVKRDGQEFPIDVALSPFSLRGEPAVLAAVRDVTERRRLEQSLRRSEEQLRQSQKLQAIGTLAAGVAHDFNNLLTVILGTTSLILDDLAPSDRLRPEVEEIQGAGERAADLTRQLLAFSRQQILHPKVLDVAEVLERMRHLLGRLVGEAYALDLQANPDVGRISADSGQIEQVLMNLVLNARDAMPDGGLISVTAAAVRLDAVQIDGEEEPVTGRFVQLEVHDAGRGMDRATRERIFEPFFTTKERGKGTGLGLSTVYGIVKQARGHILARSEPGVGSTFTVLWPSCLVSDADLPSANMRAARVPRGSETILLVEDDAQVLGLARSILRGAGYEVLDAANGGEALLVCERYHERIDLLVTDLIMPRMRGDQLAKRLAALKPGMRVLFMSGYAEGGIVREGVLDRGVAFLQKPFTPDVLLERVREVLELAST